MGSVEMLGGMFINRIIATSNMSTDQTDSQMNPPPTYLQTLLTTLSTWRDLMNLIKMSTGPIAHGFSPAKIF
jgi:hypothetical protein